MKKVITFIAVAIVTGMVVSSCASNKYGCKSGAGRQSWNKMVRRINNGY